MPALTVTPLEDRTTPATANLVDGTLTIEFTAANEAVRLNTTATDAVLTGAGFKASGEKFELAKINRLVLTDSANLGGQQITFTGLTMSLANGLKSTGVDSVIVSAPIITTGDSSVDIAAPRLVFITKSVTAGNGGLRLVADGQGFASNVAIARSVVVDSGAVVSATGNGAVFVQATAIGTPAAVGEDDTVSTLTQPLVVSNSASITSSGGNVTVIGLAEAPTNVSSIDRFASAVSVLSNGKISAGGNGTVSVSGVVSSRSTSDDQHGIILQSAGSIGTTGTGHVTVSGTSNVGRGVTSNSGLNTSIFSGGGDVTIVGLGGTNMTFENGNGIDFNSTKISTTDSGNITLMGTSGNGKNRNIGVSLTEGTVSTVNGAIDIKGKSIATFPGDKNHGVLLSNAEIGTTGTGKVNITGQGGSALATGGAVNNATGASVGIGTEGVDISITTKSGDITLTGTGGQGIANNVGVVLRGLLQSDSGNISVNGTGGGQPGQVNNVGVRIEHSRSDRLALKTVSGGITISAKATEGSIGTSYNSGSILTDTGKIFFQTDSYENLLISQSIVEAKSGTVAIGPLSVGTKVAIGGDDVLSGSPLTLGISDDELNNLIRFNIDPGVPGKILDSFNILTANLEFGSNTAGDVTHVSNKLSELLVRASGKSVTYRTAGEVKFNQGVTQSQIFEGQFGTPTPYKVIGKLDVSNAVLRVQLVNYAPGTQITLFENDGTEPSLGSYSNSPASTNFRLSYTGGDGNDIVLTVPEAGTPLLPPGPIVNPAGGRNIPPSISEVYNVSLDHGEIAEFIVQVSDIETPAQDLVVTGKTNLPTLVADSSFSISLVPGRPNERLVRITPVPGPAGVATATLTVADADGGTSSSIFTIDVGQDDTSTPSIPPTVPPPGPNEIHTISDIPDQTSTGGAIGPVPVIINDTDNFPSEQFTFSVQSSAPDLIPVENIVIENNLGVGFVLITPVAGRFGHADITILVSDNVQLVATETFRVTVSEPGSVSPPSVPPTSPPVVLNGKGIITASAERGSSTVNVYNADGSLRLSVQPFGDNNTAVRSATGDFNNDGVEDIVVGTGAGVPSRVSVFDGNTLQQIFTFEPYESTFIGGVLVAAGDLNGDGYDDVVVTPDTGGGPRVRVVQFGATGGTPFADFLGIEEPNFRGGARATVGDVDGDGTGDLIVAAGIGGGPRVAVYNGSQLSGDGGPKLVADFFAFEQTVHNGAYVAAGDVNGDGRSDIVFGGGPGGGPRVFVIDGRSLMATGSASLTPVANYFAGNIDSRDGVRVAVKDLDRDSLADIVTASDTRLTAFTGTTILASSQPATTLDFTAFPELGESVFVG